MPNWCYNELEILVSDNSKTTITDIKNKILDSKDKLDFEKIIPMPKDIYRGELGDKEQKKYGKKNWYDWSIEHWGTKWNADTEDIDIDDDRISIRFSTAWSPPLPVIKKLHEMFDKDEVTIIGHYLEETWDYSGVYHREAMGLESEESDE